MKMLRALEITMNHAAPVQRVEPVEHCDRDPHGARRIEHAFGLADRPQVVAFEAIHLDERAAIVGDTGIVNTDERGMPERGGLARLAHEARRELGIFREPRMQDLERDVAAQQLVVRGIHRCDAARTDQLDELVLVRDRAGRLEASGRYPGHPHGSRHTSDSRPSVHHHNRALRKRRSEQHDAGNHHGPDQNEAEDRKRAIESLVAGPLQIVDAVEPIDAVGIELLVRQFAQGSVMMVRWPAIRCALRATRAGRSACPASRVGQLGSRTSTSWSS